MSAGEDWVIVHFIDYGKRFWTDNSRSLDTLFALEDVLEAAVIENRVGELDGDEIETATGRDGTIYLFGPDAEAIYDVILPIVVASPVTRGGRICLRFAGPDQTSMREEYREIPLHLS